MNKKLAHVRNKKQLFYFPFSIIKMVINVLVIFALIMITIYFKRGKWVWRILKKHKSS
ncbi:hypothetical protein B4167_2835 [Caldibacillus thermoamylovorans]|uniref:Uncharacterized protein n=1 Tax=Caldibacillus thermoamylovorans TaxID=35841 RepID=A0ABD4A6J7_9BACI|nr:hypothetical protein B4167_2835 [Caldibacillus thermoamylovorans]